MQRSTRPYKTLRYHREAIRKAVFHRRFPVKNKYLIFNKFFFFFFFFFFGFQILIHFRLFFTFQLFVQLFATASDDTTIHVFHGMVYDDLASNALIVPLKVLRGQIAAVDGLGVLDIAWHPTQVSFVVYVGCDLIRF